MLIEVDVLEGTIAIPLSKYAKMHTRICRPVNLSEADVQKVVQYAIARLGNAYDLKNVIDLARYLLPAPPIPARWRRRLLTLGSGDPTKAICSTLIAQAFESVKYPILPLIVPQARGSKKARRRNRRYRRELLHIRHHSLYAPRDFDISPYFQVVKPTIEYGFNYKEFRWHKPSLGTKQKEADVTA